jgi:hypothetical protein
LSVCQKQPADKEPTFRKEEQKGLRTLRGHFVEHLNLRCIVERHQMFEIQGLYSQHFIFFVTYYCKQVPSETTGASSDAYCQSMIIIFKHHALFYVKSIQVKHSRERGREHRERERDVANWGERERTEMMRENGVGFKRRSTLVDFD